MKINKNYGLICLLFLLFALPSWAQEEQKTTEELTEQETKKKDKTKYKYRRILYREFSFNLNSIFQHVPILPFGENNLNAYSILFRKRKTRSNTANRFGLSGTFAPGSNIINNFVLKWGREWHNPLINKWSYYVGFDILAFVDVTSNDGGGLGTGPIAGLRFELNDRLFLSTESSLYLTIGGGTLDVNLGITARPPSALALNIRFVKPPPKE